MVAEEDIDSETLQAQIDMSMSFVHNLVTSWIHPTHAAQLRAGAPLAERMLDEELRRPVRLGVGAPIPSAPPAVRDAAKLKHKLSKVKLPTLEQPFSQPPPNSDDEEKGRELKRKAKYDPFAMQKSKKKRKISEVLQTALSSSESSKQQPFDGTVKEDAAIEHTAAIDVGSGPHHKQEMSAKRAKKLGIDTELKMLKNSHQLHLSSQCAVDSPPPIPCPAHVSPVFALADSILGTAAIPRLAAAQQPDHLRTVVPEPSGSQTMRNGLSLLNLDGPPESLDRGGNASNPNNSRKRRKKRKKKKAQTDTGTGSI